MIRNMHGIEVDTTNKEAEIVAALKAGRVEITYEKKNEDCTTRVCTLNPELIEAATGETEKSAESNHKPNPDVCTYYQLGDSEGWRSFRWENFISYKTL